MFDKGKTLSYIEKHSRQLSKKVWDTAKNAAILFFDTKSYHDDFLRENGEPTMDEYAEIMRKVDLKTEKEHGYYFGNVEDLNIKSKENSR